MKIIGTGLSGLLGSRVVELLSPLHEFQNLSLETGIDITKPGVMEAAIQNSDASWVFHFAAKTDVDGAEKELSLGEKSSTWQINVDATERIALASKKAGKHILYISTDFVFDGTEKTYGEDAQPNPKGFYAKTKYEGEKRIATLGEQGLIVRIANPYRYGLAGKADFVHKIRERLVQNLEVVAPIDSLFVPTFIDDIAEAIEKLITDSAYGIYHVVGSQALSPFEAAQKIAAVFGLSKDRIKETDFASYFAGRAPRPFHAVLTHAKITKRGILMKSFDEGLLEVATHWD